MEQTTLNVIAVPVTSVYADPAKNTRKHAPARIEELALSMVEDGQLEAAEVQELPPDHPQRANGFECELVFGFRRHMAIEFVNKNALYDGDKFPGGFPIAVRVVEGKGEKEKFLSNVAENVQREEPNPIDKAYMIKRGKDEHGVTQREMAKRLNIKESTASALVKLLDAPPKIQKRVVDGKVSWDAVVVALSLEEDERKAALDALSKDAAAGEPKGRAAVRAASRGKEDAEGEGDAKPKKAKATRTLKEVRVYFAERAEPEEGEKDKRSIAVAEQCKAIMSYIDGRCGYKKLDMMLYPHLYSSKE